MRYALIMGVSDYTDPKLARLKTPAADSQALAKALRNKSIGGFDQVTALTSSSISKARREISTFLSNKKPEDLVLFYFSGHGVLDERGRLFLALKDTQANLLNATAIPSSFILEELDECRSKQQVVILDCCHSGAFERGAKGLRTAITGATFESDGAGRVVLTASDSMQFAFEGDQVIQQAELSLFTHFLLKGLTSGAADTDGDGRITLDELYDYTLSEIQNVTPKQVPHKWSYHQQGDLVIARNPHWREKPSHLPDELLDMIRSRLAGTRLEAIQELSRCLRSSDAGLAKLARFELEKLAQDDSRAVSAAALAAISDFQHGASQNPPPFPSGSGTGNNLPVPPNPPGDNPPSKKPPGISSKLILFSLVGLGSLITFFACAFTLVRFGFSKLVAPVEVPAQGSPVILSSNPLSTSTAAPRATATKSPTRKPQPTSTPTRKPQPTNTPGPVRQTLLRDDFSDPGSGWRSHSGTGTVARYTGDDQYLLQAIKAHQVVWSTLDKNFKDISIEVDATKSGGPDINGFGLVCRLVDNRNFYAFLVASTGYYAIWEMTAGEWDVLVPWTAAPSLVPGDGTNRLRADCVGATLSFFINDVRVSSVTDTSLPVGDTGIIVSAFEKPDVAILFDDFIGYQP